MAWWYETGPLGGYDIVIHDKGEFNHVEELRNKIVLRVFNKQECRVWLIPMDICDAENISQVLSSLCKLNIMAAKSKEARTECQK